MAGVLLALVALGIAVGNRGDHHRDAAAAVVDQVAPIARNVERIRGLRFRKLPRPEVETPAATRAAQLAELDRSYPAARRRTDAELLATLGLVPRGTDLREVVGAVSSEQVAGFYDPRRKRLAIVDGPAARNRVLAEITLAHELDHALDDQRFGLRDDSAGTDDAASAYTALVEGTATAVMDEYAQRYIPPGAALLSVFSAVGPAGATHSIPPYLQRALEFGYSGGERFVSALREREGGRWTLVDNALAKAPPVSTEQVMHPEKYLQDEGPLPVRIGPLGLGAGWRRAAAGTLGEFDTRELLTLGNDNATAGAAAAGWGGGRYGLWERGAARVVILRWRWDSPRDAREFDAALPLYLLKGLKARSAGPARWRLESGGAAAIGVGGDRTTLAFAPSPAQAAALTAPRR